MIVRHIRTGNNKILIIILTTTMTARPLSLFYISTVIIQNRIRNTIFIYFTDIYDFFIFQQFQPVQQVFSAVCEVTTSSICVFDSISHKVLLHVHHFGQYHFINPASYIICPANPFHLISGFQFFSNVFLLHYLLHK